MRLATFNLFSGRSLTDGRIVASRLHDAVVELAADVLGLQEVDRGQERSGGVDMTAAVAASMGVPAEGWRFTPALHGTPGGAWTAATDAAEDRPAYGVGLVSRLPVQAWHVVRLPSAPVRSPVLIPSAGGGRPRAVWLRDEPRVGLAAVVTAPGIGTVTVATTHLSFVPGWNVVQLRRLVAALAALPRPVVLLGDLNLPGGLPALGSRGWTAVARGHKTYPAPDPKVQFDHVLTLGDGLPPARSAALELPLSDHRALVIDLSVPDV